MPKRLAIVTGANKGIGYHCVEQLRDALPAADADVLLPRDGGDPPEAPPSGCFVRPRQVITDKASTERWAEWTVWSGANDGEHYLDVERGEAGEAPGGIVVEESPRL